MADREIRIVEGAEAVARAAADVVATAGQEALAARGRFTLVLSGGSTPRSLYQLLASDDQRDRIPWAATDVILGDERQVGPEHPDSNYGMIRSAFAALPEARARILRFHGERSDAAAAAAAFETDLRVRLGLAPEAWPRFDLVLLGMGEDGHTASLFPQSPALTETQRIAVANWVEKLHAQRLTLSLPAINHARAVAFLVSGSNKADTLARVLAGPHCPADLPAQAVAPADGRLLWILDRDAAKRLPAAEVNA